jgi:hypothetical protein
MTLEEKKEKLIGLKVLDLLGDYETTIVTVAESNKGETRVKLAFDPAKDKFTGLGTWRSLRQIKLL